MSGATVATAPDARDTEEATGRRSLVRRALRHPLVVTGSIIVLALAVVAVFGHWLAPFDPTAMDFTARFAPPSLAHPFGTDDFGRDVFSRVLYGAAVSFEVDSAVLALAAETDEQFILFSNNVPLGAVEWNA